MFGQSYEYLSTFLKQEYERVRSDFKFFESYTCSYCEGEIFENGTCQYCKKEDSELKIRIKKLDASLDRVFDIINKFGIENYPNVSDYFNSLYGLLSSDKKLFDKRRIELLLNKVNYKDVIHKLLIDKINSKESLNDFENELLDYLNMRQEFINPELIEKIKIDYELTDKDISDIELLLNLGLTTNEDIFLLANYVIKESLLKKKTFSYNTLERAFVQVSVNFMNVKLSDSVCTIVDEIKEETADGTVTYGTHYFDGQKHIIKILRECTLDLYNSGKSFIFDVLFHEIRHIVQSIDKNSKEAIPSKNLFLQAMEVAISQHYTEYWTINYQVLNMEVEARIDSYSKRRLYLESLGVEEESEESIDLKIEEELEKYDSELRMIDEEEVDLELFFNKYSRGKPNYLLRYPILNYKYKLTIDGYALDLKSREELNADMINELNTRPEYANQIKELYEFLFEGLEKQERNLKEQQENYVGNKKS